MLSVTLSSEEKKGWFSPALLKKNAARFWPLWAAYAAVQFFSLPMELLMDVRSLFLGGEAVSTYFRRMVYQDVNTAATFGIVFGLLYAMALFSYLMDSRSVGMIHSLPVRREGLFATNYTLALLAFLVPDTVMALITIAAGAAAGVNLVGEVLLWLAVQVIVGMFFFSFAVCCAMFTGQILALPVFYGILNLLVYGLSALLDGAMSVLLLGHPGEVFTNSAFVRWCTPVWHIEYLIRSDRLTGNALSLTEQSLSGTAAALGYSVVLCAVFTSIALLVYRLRELERAGDLVTVGWVRPVFQYGLGVCVGLSGGLFIYARFRYGYGWTPAVFIALVAVWAFIGAVAGRMLLKKSLKVLAEGWKGPVVLGVCTVLFLVAARADLFGYQRWTPDPARVASVNVSGIYSSPSDDGRRVSVTLTDPETVKQVVELHKTLTADLVRLQKAREGSFSYSVDGAYSNRTLWLTYTMDDGAVFRREWGDVPILAAEVADGSTYAGMLQALINRPDVVEQNYLGARYSYYTTEEFSLVSQEAVGGYLRYVNQPKREEELKLVPAGADYEIVAADRAYPYPPTESDETSLSMEEARELWEAIRKDMAAGNLGRRYLLDNDERYENCYMTDLYLELLRTWVGKDNERNTDTWTVCITMQKSATETMKVLEKLGYAPLLREWDREDGKG